MAFFKLHFLPLSLNGIEIIRPRPLYLLFFPRYLKEENNGLHIGSFLYRRIILVSVTTLNSVQ